jgi:hypothetical protein
MFVYFSAERWLWAFNTSISRNTAASKNLNAALNPNLMSSELLWSEFIFLYKLCPICLLALAHSLNVLCANKSNNFSPDLAK